MHELDHLKDRGKLSIQPLARRAINYLHGNFSSKHPRVRGQKLSEATQNSSNCADDNILRSCLQLKEQGCDVVGPILSKEHLSLLLATDKVLIKIVLYSFLQILLSNDINLCNKALVCDVTAVSKDQFYEQFYSGMKVISTKNNNSEPQSK